MIANALLACHWLEQVSETGKARNNIQFLLSKTLINSQIISKKAATYLFFITLFSKYLNGSVLSMQNDSGRNHLLNVMNRIKINNFERRTYNYRIMMLSPQDELWWPKYSKWRVWHSWLQNYFHHVIIPKTLCLIPQLQTNEILVRLWNKWKASILSQFCNSISQLMMKRQMNKAILLS